MNDAPHPAGLDELLAHGEFVRRVVAALLPDSHDVDDVVQDTWIRAIERPPTHAESARSWLARVARNAGLNVLRNRTRRSRREQAASRPEGLPPEIDSVERLGRHRAVVDAVLALPDDLRSIVTARYYEGRPLAQIAADHGVSVPTVRSRMRRAMAVMRERLDKRHGRDGAAWLAVFAPLAAPSENAPPATGAPHVVARGAFAMNSKAVVVAAVALLLLGGAGAWMVARGTSEPGADDAGAASAPIAPRSSAAARPDVRPSAKSFAAARRGAQDAVAEHQDRSPAPPPSPTDASSKPPGAREAAPATAKVERRPAPCLKGHVVDLATGTVVAGARVYLVCYDDGKMTGAWGADADVKGAFTVGPTGGGRLVDRVELRTRAPGYRDGYAPPEEGATITIEKLDRPLARGRLSGFVTDYDCHPAAGRFRIDGMDTVGEWFGQWTTSGVDGTFVLEGLRPGAWRFTIENQCALVDATIPEGGEARLEFRLKSPLAAAAGATRAVRVAGLPTDGTNYLLLRTPGTHQFWRVAVRDGSAVFSDAPVGSQEFVLERDDREEAPRAVVIEAGEAPLEVDWTRPVAK